MRRSSWTSIHPQESWQCGPFDPRKMYAGFVAFCPNVQCLYSSDCHVVNWSNHETSPDLWRTVFPASHKFGTRGHLTSKGRAEDRKCMGVELQGFGELISDEHTCCYIYMASITIKKPETTEFWYPQTARRTSFLQMLKLSFRLRFQSAPFLMFLSRPLFSIRRHLKITRLFKFGKIQSLYPNLVLARTSVSLQKLCMNNNSWVVSAYFVNCLKSPFDKWFG